MLRWLSRGWKTSSLFSPEGEKACRVRELTLVGDIRWSVVLAGSKSVNCPAFKIQFYKKQSEPTKHSALKKYFCLLSATIESIFIALFDFQSMSLFVDSMQIIMFWDPCYFEYEGHLKKESTSLETRDFSVCLFFLFSTRNWLDV